MGKEKNTLISNNDPSSHCTDSEFDAYEYEEPYDCTILVENAAPDEKKLFRCNKQTLSAASLAFAAMFSSQPSESTTKSSDDPIKIGGVSTSCFDIAMRFVYGKEKVIFSSLAQAKEVAIFAHQWKMKDLVKLAVVSFSFECFNVQREEFFHLYKFCKPFDVEEAEEYLKKYLQQCPGFISSGEWLVLPKETIVDILSVERPIRFDERRLFVALLQWGEHQIKCRGDRVSTEATRAELSDLLPLIRFRALTSAQFAELCGEECSKVLSDFEKFAIFKCLVTGKRSNMPPKFSRIKGAAVMSPLFNYHDILTWHPSMFDCSHPVV